MTTPKRVFSGGTYSRNLAPQNLTGTLIECDWAWSGMTPGQFSKDALSRSAVAALECHHDSRGQGGKSATGDYGRGHSDYAPDVWPGHISGANGQDPMRNETRPFIRGRYPSSLSRTGLSYQQCRKVLMRLREFSCVPTKLGYDISTQNLWDI